MLEGGSHDAWLRLMHETAMERTGVLRRENNPVVSGSEHDGSELIGLVCPPLVLNVAPLLKFAHRWNPDGTVDSICRRCRSFAACASSARYESRRFIVVLGGGHPQHLGVV